MTKYPAIAFASISITAAIALSGCNGGGGSSMTETMPKPALEPAAQLQLSEAPQVNATSADDTLARKLEDPEVAFAPFSVAMKQDLSKRSVELATDFRIVSISSDGDNGFHVTYRVGDAEHRIHFSKDEFTTENGRNNFAKPGDLLIGLWDKLDGFDTFNQGDNRAVENRKGSPNFRYLDAMGGYLSHDQRYRFVTAFGARTEPDALPSGTADYTGRWRTDSLPADVTNYNASGIEYRGRLKLTADFDAGTLGGAIDRVRSDARIEGFRSLSSETGFDISDGKIADGQFTATMTGYDRSTEPTDQPEDTLKGYEGDMYGAFFGPAAEEIGGVAVAENADHNRILSGLFGGKQVTALAQADTSPISAAIKRDFRATQVASDGDSRVTEISSDGADGLRVAYEIDGTEHMVHLEAKDYGSDSRLPTGYYKANDDRVFTLSSYTKSFLEVPEFDHLDINVWQHVSLIPGSSTRVASVVRGQVIYGSRTDSSDLPAGTATYAGRMYAEKWSNASPALNSNERITGQLSLTADFAAASVNGTIDQLRQQGPGPRRRPYRPMAGSLAISQGSIAGNSLTGRLTGLGYDGTVEGAFYGPAAAEVGAVIQAAHAADSATLTGFIGGKKQ